MIIVEEDERGCGRLLTLSLCLSVSYVEETLTRVIFVSVQHIKLCVISSLERRFPIVVLRR
jgi:hypothetical protein